MLLYIVILKNGFQHILASRVLSQAKDSHRTHLLHSLRLGRANYAMRTQTCTYKCQISLNSAFEVLDFLRFLLALRTNTSLFRASLARQICYPCILGASIKKQPILLA